MTAKDVPLSLVLGTAMGYAVEQVRVFVESLRRHFDGPVMLLVSSQGTDAVIDYLLSRDITPVFFDTARWIPVHVQVSRYIRYGEVLRGSDIEYDRVLLSDVADVMFQADPFRGLPEGDLLCFLERDGLLVGQSPVNSMWIEQVFGREALARVKHQPVSCSGTTIGSHAAIVGYIDLLLSHAPLSRMTWLSQSRGHDQGIHNYLLATGALPHAQLIANETHVYTVGLIPEDQITLGPAGAILTPSGHLPPIVHQYTYKPAMIAHVREAYPITAPPPSPGAP